MPEFADQPLDLFLEGITEFRAELNNSNECPENVLGVFALSGLRRVTQIKPSEAA